MGIASIAALADAANNRGHTRPRDPPQGSVQGLPGIFGNGPSPLYRDYQADLDAYSQIYPLPCPQGNVEVRCPLWYPEDQEWLVGSELLHTEDPYEYVIVKEAAD